METTAPSSLKALLYAGAAFAIALPILVLIYSLMF